MSTCSYLPFCPSCGKHLAEIERLERLTGYLIQRAEKAEADAERLAVALRKQGEFLDRVMPDSRVDAWFELAAPALAAHEEGKK